MLELDEDFFGKKMECVRAGISGRGATVGPRDRGACPGGVGAPSTLEDRCFPFAVFSVPKILK